MGGVDLSDQQRNYYAVGCKSCKWWHYLLWFLIDVSIVNAHILETEAENHRSRPQLQFRVELAKTLLSALCGCVVLSFCCRELFLKAPQITQFWLEALREEDTCVYCLP